MRPTFRWTTAAHGACVVPVAWTRTGGVVMSAAGTGRAGLSVAGCLNEISARMTEAAAVAKAAVACAAAGSEREAVRIAMDLDVLLNEATTLHGALCLIGRMDRQRAAAPAD